MKALAVFPQGELYGGRTEPRAIGAYLSQLEALTPYFEHVTLCARLRPDGTLGERRVDLQRFSVEPLPPYAGRRDFAAKIPRYRERILAAASAADLSLVVLPGYLGALASLLLQRHRLPLFHWVVGDWGRVVLSRRPAMPGRVWARGLRPILDASVARLTRPTLTFWNGAPLYGAGPAHHHVRLSSGIRAEDLRPAGAAPQRAEDGTEGSGRLLFAGRLSAEKGLGMLLRALPLLDDGGGAPASLDLLGEGAERMQLEAEARRRGLEGRVRFHGWVPHGPALWRYLDAAEAVVLPSLEDLQPRLLLEAMARRVPLVATRVGQVASVVRHEHTGLLVPPGSPEAIAAAITRLRREPGLREAMVERAAAFAAEHTLEQETERMMAVVSRHFGGSP
jgi:glycosyltransferase involved in cell wall biosynthesis